MSEVKPCVSHSQRALEAYLSVAGIAADAPAYPATRDGFMDAWYGFEAAINHTASYAEAYKAGCAAVLKQYGLNFKVIAL